MTTHRYPLNRFTAFVMAVFHVGAIAALFSPSWGHLSLSIGTWVTGGLLGITMCYHRLLAHRSYKTYLLVEYFQGFCAMLTLQGAPTSWVSTHRKHHTNTDEVGLDPHTPREGGMWAHLYWMLYPDPQLKDPAFLHKWAKDLYKHRYYRWAEKAFWVPTTLLGLTCLYFGGFTAVLWGVALPITVGWHATWLVNSAAHIWGYQNFDTGDDSKNNWWVALLSFGEGWHNNHHFAQASAKHGGRHWWEVDVTYESIKAFESVGLAWEVNEPEV